MKLLKIVLFSFLGVLLLAVGWGAAMFAEPFAAAQSVESPCEGLYALTYRGDYGFDDFLQRGGASSADEMALYITEFLTKGFVYATPRQPDFGCSVMTAEGE